MNLILSLQCGTANGVIRNRLQWLVSYRNNGLWTDDILIETGRPYVNNLNANKTNQIIGQR